MCDQCTIPFDEDVREAYVKTVGGDLEEVGKLYDLWLARRDEKTARRERVRVVEYLERLSTSHGPWFLETGIDLIKKMEEEN